MKGYELAASRCQPRYESCRFQADNTTSYAKWVDALSRNVALNKRSGIVKRSTAVRGDEAKPKSRSYIRKSANKDRTDLKYKDELVTAMLQHQKRMLSQGNLIGNMSSLSSCNLHETTGDSTTHVTARNSTEYMNRIYQQQSDFEDLTCGSTFDGYTRNECDMSCQFERSLSFSTIINDETLCNSAIKLSSSDL